MKANKYDLVDSSFGNHTNKEALSNGIKYISRTRNNETRSNELVYYGATGVSNDPKLGYQQMLFTQKLYKKTDGKRCIHHIFGIGNESSNSHKLSDEALIEFAGRCSENYYHSGFQNAYALHKEPSGEMHIHFIINPVNFKTGLKYHEHYAARLTRSEEFSKDLLETRIQAYKHKHVSPITFIDKNERGV